MSKKSKTKGSGYERKVAKMLKSIWPDGDFERTPMSGGSQLRVGWKLTGDIVTNSSTFDFCVECKKVEGWRLEQLFTDSTALLIYKWWNQASEQAQLIKKKPMLIFSRNNIEDFVAIKSSHWPNDLNKPSFYLKTPYFVIFRFDNLRALYERESREKRKAKGSKAKDIKGGNS